jgi:hypothetical protein
VVIASAYRCRAGSGREPVCHPNHPGSHGRRLSLLLLQVGPCVDVAGIFLRGFPLKFISILRQSILVGRLRKAAARRRARCASARRLASFVGSLMTLLHVRANGAGTQRCEQFTKAKTVYPAWAVVDARFLAKHRVGMASRDETLARRIVRDVWVYTGGQAGRWAMLHSIARRLVLRHHEEVDRAVKLAEENGWLDLNGLYSVRLTEIGRRLFGENDKR